MNAAFFGIQLAKLAAEYAKEITVAKMPASEVDAVSGCGQKVAEFYTELYKGIYAALKDDLAAPKMANQVNY